ncbi:bifunctional 2-polyprenyl-6-hydroxyphenol methylase/3-demethylubiquinol 3-O-methyltransferase UbiG [Humibacter sp. RRB41]|uniref:class I SAM-dependent methyltransferase n=1 Tax=Humibacter sp. RRB41 TaxID=2919946 RepID=UPI001FA979C6|nr:class I SAM-dependent methyltransferase [Humibacter sp. RRB41]
MVDAPREPAPFPPLAIRAQLRWGIVGPIVEELAPTSVIEVGVGQGAVGARIASMTHTYVGVEIDRQSYEQALVNIAPFGGSVYNGMLSEVWSDSADLVCAFEVLEHIEDDAGALVDWVSHINPGGHLLLSVPANPDRYGPMDEYAGHFRRYSPESITAAVLAAGLVDVRATLYGSPLGYALEAVRNPIDARKLKRAEGLSVEDMTKASGRTFQFGRRSWKSAVATTATAPFVWMQRHVPGGIGLVVVARRPAP